MNMNFLNEKGFHLKFNTKWLFHYKSTTSKNNIKAKVPLKNQVLINFFLTFFSLDAYNFILTSLQRNSFGELFF